jgi:hypothetical protein
MRKLTNAVMLAAAQRKLAMHLETRPATKAEAASIRASLLQRSAALRQAAGASDTSARLALQWRADADAIDLQAAAWDGDMTAAWNATKAAFQARVAYYESLCNANHG